MSRLIHWEWHEAWISHGDGHGPQHPRAPEEELEEDNLPELPSEFFVREHLDARLDIFSGLDQLPKIEIHPGTTSFIITIFRLQEKKAIKSLNSLPIRNHVEYIMKINSLRCLILTGKAFEEGGGYCAQGSPSLCRDSWNTYCTLYYEAYLDATPYGVTNSSLISLICRRYDMPIFPCVELNKVPSNLLVQKNIN